MNAPARRGLLRTSHPSAIAGKYVFFAAIATGANLSTQAILDHAYQGTASLYVGLFAGTLVGLVLKYLLDKRYIFFDPTRGVVRKGWQFARYGLTGGLTTAVFWGMELGALHLIGTRPARYLGGALGLALGYWLKYQLDRRLVFDSRSFGT